MLGVTDRTRFSVTVDHRELEVDDGLTILQALSQEGVRLPSLCNDVRAKRSNGNCGLCVVEVGADGRPVKACITPIRPGMDILTHSPSLDAYRKVRLEQILCDHNADCVAPCQETCPARIDIQGYLAHVVDGNFEAALRVIKDRNPFPSVCGRVCPHPCEDQCRRNLVDEPVAINHVKRFVADWDAARETPWIPRAGRPTGKRVAVVGAGPSGLSAASYLALAGHAVTVFEKQPEAGGMMRYGIPEYRLPKATLDAEIRTITALGVQVVTGKALGTHLHLEDLQSDFDAVYLAIGSWQATPLALDGDNLDGVWLGIHYLEAVTKGVDPELAGEVVVIGGGNTAIDCARTALRRGASHVRLLYRRTLEEMPADRREVADALAEGVEMVFLAAPARITLAEGRKVVHCLRMELGEPDRSGRRRPVPVEGSAFELPADTVIGAIGQSTNTKFLYHDLPVRLNKWGDIDVDGATLEASEAKIFAGGDCVTGPATVIQAVAAGRAAARSIDEFVTRGYVRAGHQNYNCSRGTLEDLPRDEFDPVPRFPRQPVAALGVAQRVHGFAEVEATLTEEQARAEAARCLHCGCSERFDCALRREAREHGIRYVKPLHVRPRAPILRDHPFIIRDPNKCIHCGRCVTACAEIEGPGVLAFQFHDGKLTVGTHNGAPLDQTDCVSCGQCVTACPCGALDYVRERTDVFRAINDPTKLVVGFVAPAPRSIIAEEVGVRFGEASAYIAGLVRGLGFDKVFDFTFAADLTICEETTEFLHRLRTGGVLPQFTSCCPGWVNLVERRHPELIGHLSSCRSPQQMMGSTVKHHFAERAGVPLEDLYVVSIVPCLAKKYEAARPEFAPGGVRDVDAVITTTELLEMAKMVRLGLDEVVPGDFDDPYRRVTGAGVIFGATGGVAAAALRMASEELTGSPAIDSLEFRPVPDVPFAREAELPGPDGPIRVLAVSGLGNAEPYIRRVAAGEDIGYHLVEIMACPGGCIAGAGNPMPTRVDHLAARQRVLHDIDRASAVRTSNHNPDVQRLYDEYYGEPCSPRAHDLLHTSYAPFRRGAPA